MIENSVTYAEKLNSLYTLKNNTIIANYNLFSCNSNLEFVRRF